MNETNQTSIWDERTLGFLVLRAWLGVRAIFSGLEKFVGTKVVQKPLVDEFGLPDASGAMVETKQKVYGIAHYTGLPDALSAMFQKEPLMNPWLLKVYAGLLGYVLIVLGVALLLGICSRATLFLMGLVYTSLTLGLILINQNDGVAWLGVHVALVVMALMLVRHNRFEIIGKY